MTDPSVKMVAGSHPVLTGYGEAGHSTSNRTGMGMANDQVWRLYRGDELVAELVVTGADFPWLNATVRATPAFDELRPLFLEELRLLDRLDPDAEAWEAVYDRVRQEVSLERPDGFAVPEFLLHVDGEDAWWRWSDEPFPGDEP
jgi:hypothetical protein